MVGLGALCHHVLVQTSAVMMSILGKAFLAIAMAGGWLSKSKVDAMWLCSAAAEKPPIPQSRSIFVGAVCGSGVVCFQIADMLCVLSIV